MTQHFIYNEDIKSKDLYSVYFIFINKVEKKIKFTLLDFLFIFSNSLNYGDSENIYFIILYFTLFHDKVD